ncbi:MAG: glycosyltransferase, partial [Oculatellaceae cyanobacterium Prado106]|nr:glycosyltransferase [Oculatellaceae cyanobacterium Prado106]
HSVLFLQPGERMAQVSVCISLYNYQDYIVETLESVYKQTLEQIDLIIVNDASTDQSAMITQRWLERRRSRFNTIRFVEHTQNSGLAAARNTAISLVETRFVFILDADNALYPRCLARCLETLESSTLAFAYPLIEKFGGTSGVIGNLVWNRDRLAHNNYIDAMALIRREALMSVGGYSAMAVTGWEDYELWCKFAERDYSGILVPEILARYRVHGNSMLQATTNKTGNIEKVKFDMKQRHPWLLLDEIATG